MDRKRLEALLTRFPSHRVLVVGDFFLDKYLEVDLSLSEPSLETGLEAYQVVARRVSPGAAGTVACNLRAMEVQVGALGIISDDGEGYELRRALQERGVDVAPLVVRADGMTPTYVKPVVLTEVSTPRELNRLDLRSRSPLPQGIRHELIRRLEDLVTAVDAVIVADQMPEEECGVVGAAVREALAGMAREYPHTVFIADSRERIGAFRGMILKLNMIEAARAVDPSWRGRPGLEEARTFGRHLFQRTWLPVYVTCGSQGMIVVEEGRTAHIPAVEVDGEIDIVGAGDAAMAAITAALCSGARGEEAALVGNLAASVTIRQLGTTGTASREDILAAFDRLAHKTLEDAPQRDTLQK